MSTPKMQKEAKAEKKQVKARKVALRVGGYNPCTLRGGAKDPKEALDRLKSAMTNVTARVAKLEKTKGLVKELAEKEAQRDAMKKAIKKNKKEPMVKVGDFTELLIEIKVLKDILDVEIINIFVAPEWTFSKPRTKIEGTEEYKASFWSAKEFVKILTGLTKLSKKHPTWLIVAGTILWALPGKAVKIVDKGKKTSSEEVDVSIVYNTAPILFNGEIIHMTQKSRSAGDCDLEHGQVFAFDPKPESSKLFDGKLDMKSVEKYTAGKELLKTLTKSKVGNLPIDASKEAFTIPIDASKDAFTAHTFVHKGVNFGIEICGDHGDMKKAKVSVDVQFLIACGKNLMEQRIAARKGGVAMCCDGGMKNIEKYGFSWTRVTANKHPTRKDWKAVDWNGIHSDKRECYTKTGKTFMSNEANEVLFIHDELIPLTLKK